MEIFIINRLPASYRQVPSCSIGDSGVAIMKAQAVWCHPLHIVPPLASRRLAWVLGEVRLILVGQQDYSLQHQHNGISGSNLVYTHG